MGKAMDVLIILIGIAVLVPVGIDLLIDVDTSGWDASIVAIWDVLPIIAVVVVLGLLLAIGGTVGRRRGLFAAAPVFLIPGGLSILAMALAGVAIWQGSKRLRARSHAALPDIA